MIGEFTMRLSAFVAEPRCLGAEDAAQAALCIEDTVAVIHGGWHEPMVRLLARLDGCERALPLEVGPASSIDQAAFLNGAAGHALDFDDVHTVGVTHPSVAIVPALLALAEARPETASRVAPALGVGIAVNVALGQVLGFGHYDKGWHATSTIGALASAAAVAHQLGLDAATIRHALALAATLAGGLQVNFGAMAKPIQAGNAAMAGLRAARMAEAGVTGAADIFAPRGFFDLYAGASGPAQDAAAVQPRIDLGSVSRKLYPCCYLTHRMIEAGRRLHALRGGEPLPEGALIEMSVPRHVMVPLTVTDPRDGMQARFCAPYTLAVALHQGRVGLADFEGDSPHRPAIRRLMGMVRIETLTDDCAGPTPLEEGAVEVRLRKGNQTLAETSVAAHPGSPADPADAARIGEKIADCLAKYHRDGGSSPQPAVFRRDLRAWLHLPALRDAGERCPPAGPGPAGLVNATPAPSERTT